MDDLQNTISKKRVLQIVVKAVNNSTGPNNLVFTLLVFGAYSCIYNIDLLASDII